MRSLKLRQERQIRKKLFSLQAEPDTKMVVPYLGTDSENLLKIFKNEGWNGAYKPEGFHRKLLSHSTDHVNKLEVSGVYRLDCPVTTNVV